MSDSSILHPAVRAALQSASVQFEAIPCREEWADTAEFCANYGISQDEACNAIIVVLKTTPKRYAACLVRADTKLDVNHRVAAEVAFKRLSFASFEEAAQISGQAIGGVTIVGLPGDIPVLIDERVTERPSVIVGGGNRTSKIRLDPNELLKLPNARVAAIAVPREAQS
ncbi:MAG TPA: YbaK/EbsC family protein [Thermoanaerobaculia bacterium]|nr:YbaK/EbsC family protein [Thermoanaerobaculia bacterium]